MSLIEPRPAEWSQTLQLSPGWYRVSGEIETDHVASLSDARVGIKVVNRRFSSPPPGPDGGSAWHPSELYFRIGKPDQTAVVICRLVGKGSARYRHLRLVKLSGPPPPGVAQVDLDAAAAEAAPRGVLGAKPYPVR